MKMYARGAEVRKPEGDSAEIKNKEKADIDNSGDLSSYEIARGKRSKKLWLLDVARRLLNHLVSH